MAENTVTILDLPEITTLEDDDLLWLTRGTGLDRDKVIAGSSLKAFLGEGLLPINNNSAVDLSVYTNNLIIRANGLSGNITLAVTNELPSGNRLIIINTDTTYNCVVSGVESITLKPNEFVEYFSDGTAMVKKIALLDEDDFASDSDKAAATQQSVKALIDSVVPIGGIIDFSGSRANTPALSGYFQLCDGSVISDADSPYNGERTENLNGANVILTGVSWTADGGGSYATIAQADLYALAVGDDVSGIGIVADTTITDITGTTVTISDTAISGSVDTTFTNRGRFVRGGSTSGIGQKDAFQGHWHELYQNSGSGEIQIATVNGPTDETGTEFYVDGVQNPITDDTNGTPRTASETRPINTTMQKAMRIK